MYFPLLKLRKWGKRTAVARRHNRTVMPSIWLLLVRQSTGRICFKHLAYCVRFQPEAVGQKTLYVQGVFLVKVGCIFVIWVLGDVVLVGQKRANAPQLQNALAAVHNRQLVLAHQLFATMSSGKFKV